jgi:uncharacterized protein YdeI (YjbR/CyaY-like superfamily)
MAEKQSGGSAKTFPASLERMQSELGWVIAHIPFDVNKVWGKRGQIRVRGEINGFGFRTSLFPTGRGTHYLLVNKQMQAGGKVRQGETAKFRLEPDREERPISVPPELDEALGESRALRKFFDQLTPSRQRDCSRVVLAVKSPEGRRRRAAQIAELLLSTMEAEKELPPVLRLAFGRDPGAWKGWQRMPPSHRRAHLFGVFYYKSPEAQARRIAKLIEAAYQYAKKA